MSDNLLEMKDVAIALGGKQVVKNISLSLAAGKTLAIVGASGSGKSTLLNMVQGILPQSARVEGDILFAGEPLGRARAEKLAGRDITMIFQNAAASFCPTRTVGSQLFELLSHRATREKNLLYIQKLLGKLALPPRVLEQYPFELSGGMGQRVGILAAMLLSPRLLLADEPTAALDRVTQRKIVRELRSLVTAQRMTMLLVTHHIGVAAYLADQLLVMKDGAVVEQGKTEKLLSCPQTAYTQRLIRATLDHGKRFWGGAADAGDPEGR